jgi:DNA-binding NarL/FixJ family response regulator
VVDDHEFYRKGLCIAINKLKYAEVIAEASSGEEFLDLLKEFVPDIVFMDIKMSGIGGIETTKEALKLKPDLKIVALSMFGEEQYLYSMIDAGAKGFLLKNIGQEELGKALKILNEGKSYFSEDMLLILTKNIMNTTNTGLPKSKAHLRLTKREYQILQLLCKGANNKDISKTFQISERTVENHKANLMQKMGVNSTSHMILYALKEKIVEI